MLDLVENSQVDLTLVKSAKSIAADYILTHRDDDFMGMLLKDAILSGYPDVR